MIRAARRRPGVAVALSYLLIGTVALAPSIRPGRTLVAADLLRIVTPYSALPGVSAAHNPLLSDIPFQFFPWFRFVGVALQHGHFPQWNPTILGGVPATPNGYLSVYYPPTWLAAAVDPFDAYNLFVLLHLAFGALGIYAFSRAVGARRSSAWLSGALTFAAAFWVHWSTHLVHLTAFVWLPWALVAVHRLVRSPSPRKAGVLALVFGLWWLGGNPQYVYDGSLLVLAYAVGLAVVGGDRPFRPLWVIAVALGGGLAIGLTLAAPVLLPSVRTSTEILRSGEPQPPRDHVPRSEAIRALVPDATGSPPDEVLYGSNDELRMDSPFVGVTTALLVAAALGGRRDRVRLLLLAALGIVAVLAYTTEVHRLLFAVLPGYDRFRAIPSRWLSVLPALALPLAALGLDDLRGGLRGPRMFAAVAGGVSVVAVVAWLARQWVRGDSPHRFFALRSAEAVALVVVVTCAAIFARRRPTAALAVLAVCAAVEIGVNTSRWYPRVVDRKAYPSVEVARIAGSRGGRVIGVGDRSIFGAFAADVSMTYGVVDSGGTAVFLPRDYDRFRRLIDDYGAYAEIYNGVPPLAGGDLLKSPLLDLLDVRTVVANVGVAIPPEYPVLATGQPTVYARSSPGAAVLVPSARPTTEADAWRRVADPSWDPTATTNVVGLRGPVSGATGTVTGGRRGTDGERWVVNAPSGGFLRVSANFDGGWTATVDGRSARVLRADAIFRGVVLGPGQHRVEFSYRNPAERTGRFAGLAALGAMGALFSVGALQQSDWGGRSRLANDVPGGVDAERQDPVGMQR